jgi:hypothetical protein
MYRVLSYDHKERAWASLLSNPLSIDESRALIKYADYIYDSCGESICGALVHMPTLFESMLIDATSLETIRKITKEKVDLNSTVGKKPKLYLHIGPPKHDTTSLQCALARMQVSCTASLPLQKNNSHLVDAQH